MIGAAELRLVRSFLYLPASNARAIEKARTLDADMIVLDLEDAVRPEHKDSARAAAVEAMATGFGTRIAAIRVNAHGTEHFGRDILAVRDSRAQCVVLPKVEHHDQVKHALQLAGKPVLAMIETPAGLLNAAAIAPGTVGLIAGTNDLAAELRLPSGQDRSGLSYALQMTVLAARAAGVAVFDGVYNVLEDDVGLRAQCSEGRAFGFDGKTLIHPSQIATANRIFGPSDDEVEAARRLIDAARGGAERYGDRMIESMHVAQAEATLAKARR